jgi:hypothetical protein
MLLLRDFIVSTTALGRASQLPERAPGAPVPSVPMLLKHDLSNNLIRPQALRRAAALACRYGERHSFHPNGRSGRPANSAAVSGRFRRDRNRIIAHFGFRETPTVSEIIVCFFLGRETIICTGELGMARWHEHLLAAMPKSERPAEFSNCRSSGSLN